MPSHEWTEQELTILRDTYKGGSDKCVDLLPGRTVGAIRAKAAKLGLKVALEVRKSACAGRTEKGKKWTPEEDAVIVRLYRKVRCADMCQQLPGRTLGAISARARALGLQHPSWSEEDDQILREHYSEGIARVIELMPWHGARSISSRAQRLGLSCKRTVIESTWTKSEEDLIRQYYPLGLKACQEKLPLRSRASLISKAQRLGLAVDKDPIIIDGEHKSVRQVCTEYNLSIGRVFALAREHSVPTVEALKKCISGEWNGNPSFRISAFTGSFGALGELKVKVALSSFPGMMLCACERCNAVHLIHEADVDTFRCEANGEATSYPEFCNVPYQFKRMAEREGISIKNPGIQRCKL